MPAIRFSVPPDRRIAAIKALREAHWPDGSNASTMDLMTAKAACESELVYVNPERVGLTVRLLTAAGCVVETTEDTSWAAVAEKSASSEEVASEIDFCRRRTALRDLGNALKSAGIALHDYAAAMQRTNSVPGEEIDIAGILASKLEL